MKIQVHQNQAASALIVTLMLAAGMGVALASYLKLVEYQNRAVVRSQYWNAAIPASEAGIEEALTHLNKTLGENMASSGWKSDSGSFLMSRTIGEASYDVWISDEDQPVITSRGYVRDVVSNIQLTRGIRVRTSRANSGMRGLIAKGDITMNGNCKVDSFDSEDPEYSTNGRYDAAKNKDNGYVGSVYGSVDTGGGGVWGYLGTGPNGHGNGNAGDKAWMASNSGIQPGHYHNDLNMAFPDVTVPFSGGAYGPAYNQNVTLTNFTYTATQITTNVYPNPEPAGGVSSSFSSITTANKPQSWSGNLTTNTTFTSTTTQPAAGTYIGNVTTRSVTQGNGKNRTTVTYYDYNKITGYTYQTTVYTYNTTTTNSTTTTSTYAVVTGSGNYEVESMDLTGQSKWLVTGDTVIHIKNGFKMAGQAEVIIAQGASLKVYVGGSAQLMGNGVQNLNQDATKYSYYGLPSNTSLHMGGNAAFTGSIYAPSADFHLGGGGNNSYDVVGAAVVSTAQLNGHFNFHYDERLGRQGGLVGFRVASWDEI